MRSLETRRVVHAPREVVWRVLTDFAAFPEWSTFVERIDGQPRTGARLRVTLRPPGGKPLTVKPRLRAVRDGEELRWLGRVLVPGLFDAEHRFVLADHPDGTLLEHAETFRGALVPLLWRSLEAGTRAGFEAFNDALAARAMGQD